jgi:hypothetical protein
MPIPSSGAISFTDITNEFGTVSPTSISKYYGLDAGIPNSGQIKFSDFYGKIINATRTIGAATDYNAYNDLSNASVTGGYKSIATIIANNLASQILLNCRRYNKCIKHFNNCLQYRQFSCRIFISI